MEHDNEADNVVDVAMLNISEALGPTVVLNVDHQRGAFLQSLGPGSVFGLAAGEQELFTVQILRGC